MVIAPKDGVIMMSLVLYSIIKCMAETANNQNSGNRVSM